MTHQETSRSRIRDFASDCARWTRWGIAMLGLAPMTGCVDGKGWIAVEFWSETFRFHRIGAPTCKLDGLHPPDSGSHRRDLRVVSGDIDDKGRVAIIDSEGTVQLYDFATGGLLAQKSGGFLGVAWSAGSDRLACLAIASNPSTSGQTETVFELVILNSKLESIRVWPLPPRVPASRLEPEPLLGHFVLSWEPGDERISVGELYLLDRPQVSAGVLNIADGRMLQAEIMAPRFIGRSFMVANMLDSSRLRRGDLWLMRVDDQALVRVRRLGGGEMFARASRPADNIFLAGVPASFELMMPSRLLLCDIKGHLPVVMKSRGSLATAPVCLLQNSQIPLGLRRRLQNSDSQGGGQNQQEIGQETLESDSSRCSAQSKW